jgi:SOS response regulatory protein OraA/RecX
VRALARRDLSARQLDERLERTGVSADARREALASAERLGYLDDERFALGRAKTLAERGLGDAAIVYDLEQAGLDESLVAPALASLAAESERAKRLASSLGGGVRAARALARKGFARESIEAALPEVLGYE